MISIIIASANDVGEQCPNHLWELGSVQCKTALTGAASDC